MTCLTRTAVTPLGIRRMNKENRRLCDFLNVPIPENDYPHLNDAARIRRAILAVRVVGWLSLTGLIGGVGMLLIRMTG